MELYALARPFLHFSLLEMPRAFCAAVRAKSGLVFAESVACFNSLFTSVVSDTAATANWLPRDEKHANRETKTDFTDQPGIGLMIVAPAKKGNPFRFWRKGLPEIVSF